MRKDAGSGYLDNELSKIISGIQHGDDDSFSRLKIKYAPLVTSLARSFESKNGSGEDYEKEAESALLKAAVKFDLSQGEVAFGLYAKICIKNALISVVRREMSKKRRTLREEKSISKAAEKSEAVFAFSSSAGRSAQETALLIKRINNVLSIYEKKVFSEYMSDKTVDEIALAVSKPKKSVNNAIYRIKTKVKALELPEK